jgi:hypothetical protein
LQGLSRSLLMEWRAGMESLSPSTINVRLSAVRKLVQGRAVGDGQHQPEGSPAGELADPRAGKRTHDVHYAIYRSKIYAK